MKVVLSRRAELQAERIDAWWRENRPAAPDLFERTALGARNTARNVRRDAWTTKTREELKASASRADGEDRALRVRPSRQLQLPDNSVLLGSPSRTRAEALRPSSFSCPRTPKRAVNAWHRVANPDPLSTRTAKRYPRPRDARRGDEDAPDCRRGSSGIASPFRATRARRGATSRSGFASRVRGCPQCVAGPVPGGVYGRDGHRCQSPLCRRRDKTPHHLAFRSRGGGDEPENVITLCVWCHLFGLHQGLIKALPPASAVRWEFGRVRS
jgi:hypothetical protein